MADDSQPIAVRVAEVVDGDTVRLRRAGYPRGDEVTVRLYGIDAPEAGQPYSRLAADALERMLNMPGELLLEVQHIDPYGRQVGLLYYERHGRKRSVNRQMIYAGYAYAYTWYGGKELGFRSVERDARRRQAGLWRSYRNRLGYDRPWHYRQERRAEEPEPARSSDGFRLDEKERAPERSDRKWEPPAIAAVVVILFLLALLGIAQCVG